MATPRKKKHPLTHLIPDPVFGKEYVSRVVNKIRDLELLEYAMEAQRNVLLYGPTGPGKTSLVLAYAALNKIPLITLQCNGGIDPATIFGAPTMKADKSITYQESDLVAAIRNGGIILLDEVNFMHPKISAVFQSLLDKRRSITILEKQNEWIEAHERLQIISCFNPDYEGTRPLNAAFMNRFALKVNFDYDPVVEKQLVTMNSLMVVAERLRKSGKEGVLNTPVSTNMLTEFEDFSLDLGLDFAVENFISAFKEYERASVREVFEMDMARIKADLDDLKKEEAKA